MNLVKLSMHDVRMDTFQLTNDQLMFTAHPVAAKKLAYIDPMRHCFGLIVETKLVTFFVLHEGEEVKEYSDNPNALYLRAFSTDQRYLGFGYAKAALLLLPLTVKEYFPTINEIVLSVNHHNEIARNLYLKVGFEDTGRRWVGRNGELDVLTLNISS